MHLYLIPLAWLYVALMMAVAEALHPNGSVLGAVFTFLLYGVGPAGLVTYLLATPLRRRVRKTAELREAQQRLDQQRLDQQRIDQATAPAAAEVPSGAQPDQGGHAAGARLPPE